MSANFGNRGSTMTPDSYNVSVTPSSRSSFDRNTSSLEDESTQSRMDSIAQPSNSDTVDLESDALSIYSPEDLDVDYDERHTREDDIENLSSDQAPNHLVHISQQAHFEDDKIEEAVNLPVAVPGISIIDTNSLARSPNANMSRARSTKSVKDPNLVTWDSPHDRDNPLNWSKCRKWASMVLCSCFSFISPMASTMIAPALDVIAAEFQITSSIERMFLMSIYLLAYAIGPFLWGPLSEVFGRVKVLQTANTIFLIFNIVCGFAKTHAQMMAFRFLAGIGGSAPQAIGSGVTSDLFKAEERGAGVTVYALMPFVSQAVAPIMGAFVTQYLSWRWVFHITSISSFVVLSTTLIFLRETHAPAILRTRAKRLIKETGNKDLFTKHQGQPGSMKKTLTDAIVRPFIMLATQPALQAIALFRAYQYGLMYLALSTFPMVFEESYKMNRAIASLNYFSLLIGFIVGLIISHSMQDKIYIFCKRNKIDPSAPFFSKSTWATLHQKIRPPSISTHPLLPEFPVIQPTPTPTITVSRNPLRRHTSTRSHSSRSTTRTNPAEGLPEHRLPLTLPFSLLIAVGLFIYGFSAGRTHWILPDIGACLFAIGCIVCFNCAQSYVVDTYTTYAASAAGAAAFVRTMAGFSFPLFAPKLFATLGVDWAHGLMGFVCLGLGLFAPLALWRWGGWLRGRSTYCVG